MIQSSGKRIKGITIELNGDATGLDKALAGIDKSIRSTESALRDVNRLLKLDPTNTQLLAQKQNLLQSEIKDTKTRLNELREADKVAKAQMESGDLGKDKYDALQREIIETEQKLKGLENTAGSSSAKLAGISEKTGQFGDKMTKAGKTLMPVSAGIAGLGIAAVKTAADFDSAMSNVQAISGATSDDMVKLRDKAREMGEKTKFSAREAGDAMSYMAMAGWKTEEMLNGIDGIMNLAAASGEDLALTSDIVTDALTGFGMAADESGKLADIMAAASSNANTNVSLLGESYKYCAAVFGSMNYTAEDAAVALGLMANAGIKGSQAGTTLKTAITNMVKPTDNMAAVMDEYGISLTNSDGTMKSFAEMMDVLREKFGGLTETERASAAATLFGKEAMAGMLSIINASPKDYEKLTKAVNNAEGSSKRMADTMNDNLAGQLTILKSQLQELAISFGEILVPAIRKIVDIIQGAVDRFNQLGETQKKIITIIGLILFAIPPLLIMIGKVSTGISAITGVLSKASGVGKILASVTGVLKTAFAGLFNLILTHPVVFAIGAIITAVVLLYTKCEWFREGVNAIITDVIGFFKDLGKNIKELLESAGTNISECVDAIGMFFTDLWNGTKEIWGSIKDFVHNTSEEIKKKAVESFKRMVEGIGNTISGIAGVVERGFNGAINFISSLPAKALGWGADFIDGFVDGIKKKIAKVTDAVKGVAGKIASYLHFSRPEKGVLHEYETWMPDFIEGMAEGIRKNEYKMENAVKSMSDKMRITPQMSTMVMAGEQPVNLQNNTTVMLGNKELKSFIVNTSTKGISRAQKSFKKAAGR